MTTLKIVLWNSGNENIDKQVKIVLADDVDIRDAQVISGSNPLNNVKIKVDPVSKNTAIINFDYLAMKEGCLISLLHTRPEEEKQKGLPKKDDLKQENYLKKEDSKEV